MIKHIVEHIDEEIQGKVCEKGCGVFHALLGYITLHGPFMYSPTYVADFYRSLITCVSSVINSISIFPSLLKGWGMWPKVLSL